MNDNKVLRFFVGFTAFVIAVCSAAFSVYGLSLIFAGIAIAIMIMASVIELGKVVSVAFLYQRWRTINWLFRFILGIMILAGMTVTSAGIFGILSSGYEKAAVELNSQENQISLLNNKKTYFVSQIKNLEIQKSFNEQRAIQLSTLRKSQEQRLDKLVDDKRSSTSTIGLIKQSNIDIDSANQKVDRIMLKISSLNDSIQVTDEKIQSVTLTNNRVGLDPLKYLSRTTKTSSDNSVKWFIALLISIFDPMAIMLLMAFNQMNLDKNKSEKEEKEEKEPILNRFKNIFKPTEPKVELPKKVELSKVEEQKYLPENTNMYNLFVEAEKKKIKKTNDQQQIEIPLDWTEKDEIVVEKKTPIGNEFSQEDKIIIEIPSIEKFKFEEDKPTNNVYLVTKETTDNGIKSVTFGNRINVYKK